MPGEALSAVERTQVLPKPAHMSPHLQFMCGPLLRYDTVIDNVWYGAAMIVTADAGSQYSPGPFIAMSWDPAVSVPPPTKSQHQHTKSTDILPFDPNTLSHMTPPLTPSAQSESFPSFGGVSGPINGHARKPSRTHQERKIEGHEIWVYHGASGTFTFWRFMIEIPLANIEMPVSYSVNNGAPIEFVVPAIGQNMRWAAHSVSHCQSSSYESKFMVFLVMF